jgi:outer membrane protein W
MLQSQLGIDYQIYNHWLLNAELNYLNAYSNQPFGIPNIQQFGGLIGVKYQF